jgi:ABC-type multidrug transport system ATPase subunit
MAIEHGALVAIIGAGGPGRATLLATICGLRPPAAGEVVRADDGNVGYVPRGDLIHPALPLARALRYAAGLRHLGDPRRVAGDALRILDLSGRSLVPAGRLSGGERKRASIAAEYLAGPGLVGLDEPTSGLDPARGAELMRTLRRLCDGGATVVLTTQSPLDVEACDKIVVLASGGDLAFFGPPAAALARRDLRAPRWPWRSRQELVAPLPRQQSFPDVPRSPSCPAGRCG